MKNTEVNHYRLSSVDYMEEAVLNTSYPSDHEPILGWRRFRIEYLNDFGFSNVEGTLYFPPGIEPYPILDALRMKLRVATTPANQARATEAATRIQQRVAEIAANRSPERTDS